MRWKFEGGKKMRGKGRTYWAEVRERRGGGEAGREEGVRQRPLWLLRQSAGSRQSADRVYSLAAVVSPGGSLARVLPSLRPPSLPPSRPPLPSPAAQHTHILTFISVWSLSVWNVCYLIIRHGEQLCGQTGVRGCSEVLERTG